MKHKVTPYNAVFAQTAYDMNLNVDPELFRDVMRLTKSFCTFCVKRNYFYNLLNTAIRYPEDVVQEAVILMLEWRRLPVADQEEMNFIIEFVHRIQDIMGIHTLHGGKRYAMLSIDDVVSLSDVDEAIEAIEVIEAIEDDIDAYNMKRMIKSCTVFTRPYVTPLEYARLNKFIEEIDRKSDTQINSLATALENRRKAVDKEIARGRSEKEVDIFIYYESQRKPIGALL